MQFIHSVDKSAIFEKTNHTFNYHAYNKLPYLFNEIDEQNPQYKTINSWFNSLKYNMTNEITYSNNGKTIFYIKSKNIYVNGFKLDGLHKWYQISKMILDFIDNDLKQFIEYVDINPNDKLILQAGDFVAIIDGNINAFCNGNNFYYCNVMDLDVLLL